MIKLDQPFFKKSFVNGCYVPYRYSVTVYNTTFHGREELDNWCSSLKIIYNRYYTISFSKVDICFQFTNEEDAMLFQLTWADEI